MLDGCVPWPDDVAAAYRAAGYWTGVRLGELPLEWAVAYGDRIAIICGDERVTYRQLAERVERLALHLVELGLRPAERVVVQLPNVPEFLYLYFALLRIGALPVLTLPPHRHNEIGYLAGFSEAVAYAIPASFRGFDYLQMARELRPRLPRLRHVLVAGKVEESGTISFDALLSDPIETRVAPQTLDAYRPEPADVALFLLSGGTTGLPKLIPRTHDDYAYNFRVAGELSGVGPQTVYLVALPISHNFPLAAPGVQAVLDRGGCLVLAPGPEPETCLPLIERERVTLCALVPAALLRWLDAPQRQQHDLSSLQVVQVGGARLNPEAARRVTPALGCRLQQVFGMAEGLCNYTRLDDPDEAIIETQGRPASPADEIRIVDDDDRPVPPGEPGHLLTRGPYTIWGYYKAEEHNRRAFTPDGFYRTGDVVRLHPSGNLSVEGREKDMINRGGEKISAEEVENLILAHPAVFNAAAVAMPDPVLGERTCAFVILRPGASLTLPDLCAFLLEQQIAKFKLPERLEVVASFPLTSVGKVSKKDLREQVASRMREEAMANATAG